MIDRSGTVRTSARSPLLRRSAPGSGLRVTREDAGWGYVSFAAHHLVAGAGIARSGDADEVLALILEGSAAVRVGSRAFDAVGTRDSVFDPVPAGVVLAEPGADVEITALRDSLVIVGSAPGGELRETRAIGPGDVFAESRGTGTTNRRIHHLLPPGASAGRLIAFEVVTPGGNWSSFPPHKHDTQDPPRESYLEEVYYYRFARPSGFAVQRVYTADGSLDETVTCRDGDLVLVPRGYHVVGAPVGYDTYYLNVMAGPTREWRFTVDPDHAWLMDWDPARPQG